MWQRSKGKIRKQQNRIRGVRIMVDCHLQDLINRPVRADDRATCFEIVRWICVSGLFVSLILAYAWSQSEILNIQYRMEQLRRENEGLLELNAALRAEQSSLLNPETIDHQAKKLGLISSHHAEVRIFNPDIPNETKSRNLVAQSQLQKKTLHE